MWTEPPERRDGVWNVYRHTSRDYPPLWYGAGQTTLSQNSGRWHEQDHGVAQYLALTPNGAWAERCRYEHIRDEPRRLADSRCLWQLQIIEHDIADLSSYEKWLACGLPPEMTVGPHDHVWPLADALRAAGYRGVLAPAAALDERGATNLILFGERIERQVDGPMPSHETNPQPDLFAYALMLTDGGPPTRQAMTRTCYLDAHHYSFKHWCLENDYTPAHQATTPSSGGRSRPARRGTKGSKQGRGAAS